MPLIASISRDERRLILKALHQTHDKNYTCRLTTILMLHRGDTVSHVTSMHYYARSSIGHRINWFTLSGKS